MQRFQDEALALVCLIAAAVETDDDAKRLRYLADLQQAIGNTARNAIAEWRDRGASWSDVGGSIGMDGSTMFRRYRRSGPIDLLRKPVAERSTDAPPPIPGQEQIA